MYSLNVHLDNDRYIVIRGEKPDLFSKQVWKCYLKVLFDDKYAWGHFVSDLVKCCNCNEVSVGDSDYKGIGFFTCGIEVRDGFNAVYSFDVEDCDLFDKDYLFDQITDSVKNF